MTKKKFIVDQNFLDLNPEAVDQGIEIGDELEYDLDEAEFSDLGQVEEAKKITDELIP